MCGISGFIDYSGHRLDEAGARVGRMSETLAHRGPDDSSSFVDARAALGHRRLSIIDIAGGAQPMATEDGRLQIIFNGEQRDAADEITVWMARPSHKFVEKA